MVKCMCVNPKVVKELRNKGYDISLGDICFQDESFLDSDGNMIVDESSVVKVYQYNTDYRTRTSSYDKIAAYPVKAFL